MHEPGNVWPLRVLKINMRRSGRELQCSLGAVGQVEDVRECELLNATN